jgi:hypothetical protein
MENIRTPESDKFSKMIFDICEKHISNKEECIKQLTNLQVPGTNNYISKEEAYNFIFVYLLDISTSVD